MNLFEKGPLSKDGVRLSLCGQGSRQVLAVVVESFRLSRSLRPLNEYIDTPFLSGILLSLSCGNNQSLLIKRIAELVLVFF